MDLAENGLLIGVAPRAHTKRRHVDSCACTGPNNNNGNNNGVECHRAGELVRVGAIRRVGAVPPARLAAHSPGAIAQKCSWWHSRTPSSVAAYRGTAQEREAPR